MEPCTLCGAAYEVPRGNLDHHPYCSKVCRDQAHDACMRDLLLAMPDEAQVERLLVWAKQHGSTVAEAIINVFLRGDQG